jgi:ribonuclease E
MANKMLIDASHPEETRVVVLRGNRVEEFDFESASKKQLRGNIYLAKVTRVEPSLQAAFVDYGGNRHGFLAFSEIHPDYYQIPVIDRQALIEEEAKAQRDEEDDEAAGQRRSRRFHRGDKGERRAEKRIDEAESLSEPFENVDNGEGEALPAAAAEQPDGAAGEAGAAEPESERAPFAVDEADEASECADGAGAQEPTPEPLEERFFSEPETRAPDADFLHESPIAHEAATQASGVEDRFIERSLSGSDSVEASVSDASSTAAAEETDADLRPQRRQSDNDDDGEDEDEHVEQLGGDAMEEVPIRPPRYRKQYKIQEVIKRRQVLLVQVVKEERGNKGAALTTYLSLAGRYSVLMPNTARGGGISRKITDPADRQRLKSIASELEVPEGMGVILRTAGASRTKGEVKRDFEYLLRMWETVRETTLKSTAPTLVYEEGSLIKRSIRDLYNKDVDEIVVAGEKGFREARDFMRLLMPGHARSVQPYREAQPIFSNSGVEAQLDAMFLNQVTLKSGGSIVINQTEALVAIDVNSGRSTREHNIEDTALRTNLEAADEVARQLRLRDLAGLIVVDFIDMEEGRNNRAVERRLKDALKNDRARIQVGRISHFGLLEMSRQRMRSGVLEGSTEICPHCSGSGMLRSTASIALHVLRVAEDALIKSASHDLVIKTKTPVALYILNEKRAHLRDLERRFGASVTIDADDGLIGGVYHTLERGEPASGGHEPISITFSEPERVAADEFAENGSVEIEDAVEPEISEQVAIDEDYDDGAEDEISQRREGESDSEADNRRRRRRRRRRGRGGDREGSGIAANAPQPPDDALEAMARIDGLQPAIASAQARVGERLGALTGSDLGFDEQPLVEVQSSPVEAEEGPALAAAAPSPKAWTPPSAEPDAPDKSGERRRPRRSAKARDAAGTGDEQAPELGLESDSPDGAGAEADLETQAAPSARRGRRTPRARAPRRGALLETETLAGETLALAPTAEEPLVEAEADAASGDLAEAPAADYETAGQAYEPPAETHTAPSAGEEPRRDATAEASEAEPQASPAQSPAQSKPPPQQEQERARPKRSGWWQRAKASLGR